MRHRISYFIAFIVAGAFAFIFKGNAKIVGVVEILSLLSVIFGLSVTAIFASTSVLGAAAGLRRTKKYGSTITKSIVWGIFATAIPVALIWLLNNFKLLGLGTKLTTIGSPESLTSAKGLPLLSGITDILEVFKANYISLLGFGVTFAVCCTLLFKIFVGYHLKPDSKVLRPAYLFYASSTELSYKIARALCNVYMILLLFVTTNFFYGFFTDKVFFLKAKGFIILLGIATVAIVFVILPILFLLLSGFKKNPITAIWTAFVNGLVGLFTKSPIFAFTTINVSHRYECYMPKKTTCVSSSIMLVFNRIGSAALSYLTILYLLNLQGESLGFIKSLIMGACCVAFSLFSSFGAGFEVLFIIGITSMIFKLDDSVFMTAGILFPILQIFSSFIDTYAISLGSNSVSGRISKPVKKA